jgi:ERCC4-type nuclease
MINIVLDSREPTAKIRPIMSKLLSGSRFKGIEVEYKKLEYGDYYIENGDYNLVIQRKAIADYVGSYGGLPDQFLNLRISSQRQALLIEGAYTTKIGNGNMFLTRHQEAGLEEVMAIQTHVRMITRLQDDGVWVYHTNNLYETILTILYIAEYLPALAEKSYSGKLEPSESLMTIGGIGEKTVRELKNKYKSPYEALLDIDNWAGKRIKDGLKNW